MYPKKTQKNAKKSQNFLISTQYNANKFIFPQKNQNLNHNNLNLYNFTQSLENPNQNNLNIKKSYIFLKDDLLDTKSVKSFSSRMSGASNFDKVLVNIVKPIDQKNQNLNIMNQNDEKNDLDFLQDDNQWASIYKYNNYLQQKKDAIVKLKEEKLKIDYKKMLDKQIEEKKMQQIKEKQDDIDYFHTLNAQIHIDQHKENQEKNFKRQKELENKAIRDYIMNQKLHQQEQEKKIQKQNDKILINQIEYELRAENEFLKYKKQNTKDIMQQMKQEMEQKNEEQIFKRRKKEQQKQEIQAENQFQKNYIKKIHEQDLLQYKLEVDRKEMLKNQGKQVEKTVLTQHQKYLNTLEDKSLHYQKRQELKQKQFEQKEIEKIQQQKNIVKAHLLNQMQENQNKQIQEYQEQIQFANVQNHENQKFQAYEQNIQQQRQNMFQQVIFIKKLQSTLKQQINQNQSCKINQSEAFELQDQILNQKLKEDILNIKNSLKLK